MEQSTAIKVATGVAAAISHWRFRNIDHRLVLQLAIPGCLGAVVGVTVLGLLMIVMRRLLRQATALRTDMEAVI